MIHRRTITISQKLMGQTESMYLVLQRIGRFLQEKLTFNVKIFLQCECFSSYKVSRKQLKTM